MIFGYLSMKIIFVINAIILFQSTTANSCNNHVSVVVLIVFSLLIIKIMYSY